MSQSKSRRSKEAHDFNSWVLGGAYSRTTLKRNQIKADLELAKKSREDSELDPSDDFSKKLEKRRQKWKEDRVKPSNLDKSKKAKDDSPRREAKSPPRAASPPENELSLRERLQKSFAQTTAAHAYGTLFPPLLTPYSRPCNFLRFAPERSSTPPANPEIPQAQTIKPPPPREYFSVAKSDRHRPQPRSGPQAFLPTGSAATAYRLLANSAYSKMRPVEKPTSELANVLHSSKMSPEEKKAATVSG